MHYRLNDDNDDDDDDDDDDDNDCFFSLSVSCYRVVSLYML